MSEDIPYRKFSVKALVLFMNNIGANQSGENDLPFVSSDASPDRESHFVKPLWRPVKIVNH